MVVAIAAWLTGDAAAITGGAVIVGVGLISINRMRGVDTDDGIFANASDNAVNSDQEGATGGGSDGLLENDATGGKVATGGGGDQEPEDKDGKKRDPSQDKILSKREIAKLRRAGENPHTIKKVIVGKRISRWDLYKDKNGNIFVKPKGGNGAGEPTYLNINDF